MKNKNKLRIALATLAIIFATSAQANARLIDHAHHEGSCVDGTFETWNTYTVGGFDTGVYIPGSLRQYSC